ncbi:HlyD family type I secretion periplasmic adaptor subunit [Endozoicomonas numazuensis]|uniref:HlyD family type I secretion periplasmic adaptor subunit n=1 Tax=Endozoicomonas numazuensis TaxID=1137799 RepID=UPI00069071B9|nr:HlyD family type I secretion periplasmic adaptor subunit [Endozoicomonas numazuensis]
MTDTQETHRPLYLEDCRARLDERMKTRGRPLLIICLMFMVVFLVWSAIAEIDELARGDGKVIPSSRVQTIQNLEGGIVSEIKVREGQTVEKGQILLIMDDTRFSSNLDEQKASLSALKMRKARLMAEIKALPFLPPEAVKKQIPELAESESALFISRRQELDSKTGVFREQLEQQRKQIEETQAKESLLKRRKALLSQELDMTRILEEEGAVSKVELLRIERQVSDVSGEAMMAGKSLDRMAAMMRETEERMSEVELNFINEARKELNETLSSMNGLTATGTALTDRVDRTRVRSPVNGIVKSIMVNTEGGVVQPGMAMLDIVPIEDSLKVEVRIRPEDIGFLHPEQQATVRFTAYDFTVHGGLKGKVKHISADTITLENGDSFYLALVETDQSYLGQKSHGKPVIPGMVATVDILTGKKTLLSYFLKPVLRAKQLAFSER